MRRFRLIIFYQSSWELLHHLLLPHRFFIGNSHFLSTSHNSLRINTQFIFIQSINNNIDLSVGVPLTGTIPTLPHSYLSCCCVSRNQSKMHIQWKEDSLSGNRDCPLDSHDCFLHEQSSKIEDSILNKLA